MRVPFVDLSTLPPATIPIEHFLPRPKAGGGGWKWQPWMKRPKPKRPTHAPPPAKKKVPAPRREVARLEVIAPRVLRAMPPIGTHAARQAYDWFEFRERVNHLPKGGGGRRVVLEGAEEQTSHGARRVPQRWSLLSGTEVKERVTALGLSTRQFASRTRMSEWKTSRLFQARPGEIPGWFVRLLEFEEFMADLADLLDTPMSNPRVRHALALLLDEQVSKML